MGFLVCFLLFPKLLLFQCRFLAFPPGSRSWKFFPLRWCRREQTAAFSLLKYSIPGWSHGFPPSHSLPLPEQPQDLLGVLMGTGVRGRGFKPHFPEVFPLNVSRILFLQTPRGHWRGKPKWQLHFFRAKWAKSSVLVFLALRKGGGILERNQFVFLWHGRRMLRAGQGLWTS